MLRSVCTLVENVPLKYQALKVHIWPFFFFFHHPHPHPPFLGISVLSKKLSASQRGLYFM